MGVTNSNKQVSTDRILCGGTLNVTLALAASPDIVSNPTDIVLVLDQSGSMSDEFSGSSNRQAAMKHAVNTFIASVADRYSSTADHRMAVVTFGNNAQTLQSWTAVNSYGEATLESSIKKLPNSIDSAATNIAAGMERADYLMGDGYSYSGSNPQNRQKVVIVFTDGVPTTSSDFSVSVANDAISTAARLKNSGTVIYTIGIFSGANPDE